MRDINHLFEHLKKAVETGEPFFPQEHDIEMLQRYNTSAEADWIPCSERLPKTGDDILVTFSDGEVDIIISARPKAWVKYEEANNLIFPVAWMPLPKPYKGGDDE